MKTNTSLLSGFGLALVGTTCCTLPIALVVLGMGGAVASMVSAMPWLSTLSQYKAITFSFTAIILTYSFRRLHGVTVCSRNDNYRLMWQRTLLWISIAILAVSLFAAYALLPLMLWWEKG